MQKTISPIDGSVCAEFELATDREIDRALDNAARAQRAWRLTPLAERLAVCGRMVDWMVAHADEIGTELTRQMGRPVSQSPTEIRRGFQERARCMMDLATGALADIDVGAKVGFRRFIRREPLGVVLVLAPWNYPYLTSVNAVVPAILAGNTVVLKVSQQTPLVASRYADAFAAAGLPSAVFQSLHTSHDDALRIVGDARVAFVSFTGSVEGGRAVQQAAAGLPRRSSPSADHRAEAGLPRRSSPSADHRAEAGLPRRSSPGADHRAEAGLPRRSSPGADHRADAGLPRRSSPGADHRAEAGLIGTNLELGGKDPAYVRADAPLAASIENLVDGAFFNAGQSCCAVERIYVHRAVFRDFVEGFVALTRQYRLGNPLLPETTLGPMVRTAAADFVRSQVRDAVRQGARALIDPREFPGDREGTPYVAPQVLVDVTHQMRVMTEETFGPVAGIMEVNDDDEAIALMNDSRYGLTASIWTADVDAAVRIGDRVETGTWFQNRCDYLDPELAWTGVKDSGRGCSLSRLGYDALTRPKSFHLRVNL